MDTAEAPRRNLLIRADSSSQIGLGHIMRDLVLAQQYPHAIITFACQNLPGNIIDRIPYPAHILASNDPAELIELIISHTIDMVVFDHYGIDALFEQKVKKETGVTILSLDDTYQKHHCDILINPNIYARPERYKNLIPSQCTLQCGGKFLLIRKEFREAKEHPKVKTDAIFIAMGGSDPDNLSIGVLTSLPANARVHLVTTSSNPHLEMLYQYAAEHPSVTLHIDAPNVAQLMGECAFAVITPSSIAHEIMFMGLPFIAVQSADNQREFVTYMKHEGLNVMDYFESNAFKALFRRLR